MNRRLHCIMLIEDCEADSYLQQKIIKEVDGSIEVILMRSGDDALTHFRSIESSQQIRPDLIFLDINTPGLEAWEFIEEFERLESQVRSGTIIVMLSGSLNPDDRDRAQALPSISEYRTKPLTRAVLRELISSHFPAN